jgi:broad specificity phosphatase PhoE
MAVEIVYETHATTTDNEAGVATGWLPGRLSDQGIANARELGVRRRDDGLAAVFVSDLARAVQTAAIAFEGHKIPILQDPRLRECDYGELNGAPIAELEAERPSHIDVPFPGGQSYRHVVDQTREFLAELAAGWDDRRVLLIAHSANRWALEHLLRDVPLEELVSRPFGWQPGWEYVLPADWTGGA